MSHAADPVILNAARVFLRSKGVEPDLLPGRPQLQLEALGLLIEARAWSEEACGAVLKNLAGLS